MKYRRSVGSFFADFAQEPTDLLKTVGSREWMGVEPTDARCSRPPTDFEDRGTHRGTSTPKNTSLDHRSSVDLLDR